MINTVATDTAPALKAALQRGVALLTQPQATWAQIHTEPHRPRALLMGYALWWAGAAAVAGFVGQAVIGVGFGPFSARVPMFTALGWAALGLAASGLGLVVMAWLAARLAALLGAAQVRWASAFTLLVYAATSIWAASLAQVLPVVGILVMLVGSVYSVYLLWLGAPLLLDLPLGQRVPFLVGMVLASVVMGGVVGSASAALERLGPAGSGEGLPQDIRIQLGNIANDPAGATAEVRINTDTQKVNAMTAKVNELEQQLTAATDKGDMKEVMRLMAEIQKAVANAVVVTPPGTAKP